jgi:hypothetical protein
MRHRPSPRRFAPALLGILAVAAGTASAQGSERDPVAEPPARLLVTAQEFSFTLSRPKVEAGPAIIQLYDYGEDPHDMQLQRIGSPRIYSMGEIQPGETGTLDLKLRKGARYRMWCSIEGHAERGMVASLRTSRK